MDKYKILLLSFVVGICLMGEVTNYHASAEDDGVSGIKVDTPVSFGEGVYFFYISMEVDAFMTTRKEIIRNDVIKSAEAFGRSLAMFLKEHPNLEVAAIQSYTSSEVGMYYYGYIVTTRDKAK